MTWDASVISVMPDFTTYKCILHSHTRRPCLPNRPTLPFLVFLALPVLLLSCRSDAAKLKGVVGGRDFMLFGAMPSRVVAGSKSSGSRAETLSILLPAQVMQEVARYLCWARQAASCPIPSCSCKLDALRFGTKCQPCRFDCAVLYDAFQLELPNHTCGWRRGSIVSEDCLGVDNLVL